jgi:ferredoxin like protein
MSKSDNRVINVEDKLANNRYKVLEGQPHVRVKRHDNPSPQLLAMVKVCPAGCYHETEDGAVEVSPAGCMECGTCRVMTRDTGELEWGYPLGGYGVQFKFG